MKQPLLNPPLITLDDILKMPFWRTSHVAIYLNYGNSKRAVKNAQEWMLKKKVKRCPGNRQLTCKAWVDEALLGGTQ